MNIVLTGFMGTGKTCVGKRLAKRLGYKFVDVDQLIEAGASMPIRKIFSERGEPVFRRLEQRIISRVVHGSQQVIATGGGAVVNPENRTRLRASGPVICLTARPQTIARRVGTNVALRPVLKSQGSVLNRIRTLLGQRANAYAKADLTIDTSDLSVEQVVERIWGAISPYLCKSWDYLRDHAEELSRRYGGRYVVVVDNRIVACGDTHLEAYQNASQRLSQKRDAGVYYIPLREESPTALFGRS